MRRKEILIRWCDNLNEHPIHLMTTKKAGSKNTEDYSSQESNNPPFCSDQGRVRAFRGILARVACHIIRPGGKINDSGK